MALTPNSPNADNSMQALKQYGSYIVTAILLALAAYFGWTYWQNNHARVDTVAADQYADLAALRTYASSIRKGRNSDLTTLEKEWKDRPFFFGGGGRKKTMVIIQYNVNLILINSK